MVSLLTGNKFDPNTDIPDLSGRTYIVTGGSAGIGFGIVAHLLQHNAAKILLLSNKKQHADEAMEELEKYGDPSRVHWVHCDLSDLAQTHQVGKTLAAQEKRIDAVSPPLPTAIPFPLPETPTQLISPGSPHSSSSTPA